MRAFGRTVIYEFEFELNSTFSVAAVVAVFAVAVVAVAAAVDADVAAWRHRQWLGVVKHFGSALGQFR